MSLSTSSTSESSTASAEVTTALENSPAPNSTATSAFSAVAEVGMFREKTVVIARKG